MRPLLFVFLLPGFLAGTPVLAQSPGVPAFLPQLIQITGSLFSPSEAASKREQTLDVQIAGEQRVLYVREVKSLTSDDRDWPMLRDLGRFLSITGPSLLIDQLKSEESMGLPLKIEGRLYMKEKVLMLTSVESAVAQLQ